MPPRKTTFALPKKQLTAIDQAAEAIRARRDAEVTRRLNVLFSSPASSAEQANAARTLDAAGTEWNDERW